MDEETRRRCLEPFFTTKGQQGTGLGLAMVYGTMQRHGGASTCKAPRARAPPLSFMLPLEAEIPEAAAPKAADVRQPLSILTVDDQPVLCEILADHLTEDWHTVETAVDGREALEKFRAGGGHPYDLVITDKAMPHMSGEQLAAAVKAMIAGHAGDPAHGLRRDGRRRPFAANIDLVVDKPVTREALREAVARGDGRWARRDVPG